jgi:hypothetical protein
MGPNASKVVVGAKELYEARCRFCHEPNLGKPAHSTLSLAGLEITNKPPAVEMQDRV